MTDANDNLTPFAAAADGPNEDHHLTAKSMPGNTLGNGTRGLANDATRTRSAGKPPAGRGADSPPSRKGVDGIPPTSLPTTHDTY